MLNNKEAPTHDTTNTRSCDCGVRSLFVVPRFQFLVLKGKQAGTQGTQGRQAPEAGRHPRQAGRHPMQAPKAGTQGKGKQV